ncbi:MULTISPECIES: hypothetical protein [Acinetobacter]|nr:MULTISPECIES: hypothetical protein [Acinetobacter]MCF3126355.1 hypothetical protein [Acinetobacter soli]MDQ8943045.1 hypothetical protein [Acinetobacter soli]MDQ8994356.1 hypothetical protein [Acinetobacter soli]MDQ9834637.1 hypothetical protein [Acinetobacter soli]MEB4800542.1 hypothetical protein [Acinetobacter soli]
MTIQLPSIMAMWTFLNENLHFKLSKYEFVEGGIKVIVQTSKSIASTKPKRTKRFF